MDFYDVPSPFLKRLESGEFWQMPNQKAQSIEENGNVRHLNDNSHNVLFIKGEIHSCVESQHEAYVLLNSHVSALHRGEFHPKCCTYSI